MLWNIEYPSPFLSWLLSINMFFSLLELSSISCPPKVQQMWDSLVNLMILPSSQFCKRPYSEDDNTKGVIKKKTETILVLVRILWMAGCVWGMWVAMSSNWKLIIKFGFFYHFALLRTAREWTKFLTLSLPQETKTEFLLTILIPYQAGRWWE